MKQFAPFEFLQKSVPFKLHHYQNFAFQDCEPNFCQSIKYINSGIENSTLDCDSLPNFWISLALITLWIWRWQFLSKSTISEFRHFYLSVHGNRGAFCQFPFQLIYHCHSSKSTRKKTSKTYHCALHMFLGSCCREKSCDSWANN